MLMVIVRRKIKMISAGRCISFKPAYLLSQTSQITNPTIFAYIVLTSKGSILTPGPIVVEMEMLLK